MWKGWEEELHKCPCCGLKTLKQKVSMRSAGCANGKMMAIVNLATTAAQTGKLLVKHQKYLMRKGPRIPMKSTIGLSGNNSIK